MGGRCCAASAPRVYASGGARRSGVRAVHVRRARHGCGRARGTIPSYLGQRRAGRPPPLAARSLPWPPATPRRAIRAQHRRPTMATRRGPRRRAGGARCRSASPSRGASRARLGLRGVRGLRFSCVTCAPFPLSTEHRSPRARTLFNGSEHPRVADRPLAGRAGRVGGAGGRVPSVVNAHDRLGSRAGIATRSTSPTRCPRSAWRPRATSSTSSTLRPPAQRGRRRSCSPLSLG